VACAKQQDVGADAKHVTTDALNHTDNIFNRSQLHVAPHAFVSS
jgi:hypothetical protein